MNPEYEYCTSSSSRRLLSKAVVSLNNSGASLLERARYSEAKTTLKEALDLFFSLEEPPLFTDEQRRQDALSRMNIALHHAEQHLARPASSCGAGEQHHAVQVTVLSNDNTSDAMETAASDFCSSQTAGDNADASVKREDSSFFNRVQANTRYEQAWPACHLAHELLSRHRLPSTVTAALPEIQRRFVLLHMLVVSNLMHLAFELGKRRRGHKFYDKLCRLREELPQTPTSMEEEESFLRSRRTAPAA